MAARNDSNNKNNNKHDRSQEAACGSKPVIFNPDFFVERLRHDQPQAFSDIVLSNLTRLIDLPGEEFAQLTGDAEPRLPSHHHGFLRSFNFLKRKDKGLVFGAPLTEEGIAQIYQLIEYLSKNLHVEGLFRVPGHSLRQAALREMLNSGAEIVLETGDFHPNDAATLLKTFLGELPEPLLTHRHYHAHLKIAERTLFDEQGNKTDVPDKERQIEAFQLLFMLLPPANRSLLKLLLDLLYHTARNQHTNKMSAINLATMFAPHIIWPKHVTANNLQSNIKRLNNGIAFLIKHSQKLFRAPAYVKEYARVYFTGSKTLQSKDDLALCTGPASSSLEEGALTPPPPPPTCVGGPRGAACSPSRGAACSPSRGAACSPSRGTPAVSRHTEEALRELQQHISSLPASAKKKKLIRQFEKQQTPVADPPSPFSRKHRRSRSLGGIIKEPPSLKKMCVLPAKETSV
ncbi:hypothetical protein NHX12_022764 [Muraenolepis orangiensis]|uniref:Rho GTPase-activating protein 19 n=1 Tax=Muraenolepis orangiensis TaxID=630683 RepID=A0A9Q0ENL3_9TELE|nr:hypothetical protein NHX12_022764 [Muraenolepis orangiensis]